MERSEARSVVHDAIRPLKYALGLGDWTVDVEYDRLGPERGNGSALGECFGDRRYRRARITINCWDIDSEEELLDVLRHELIHLIGVAFDVYREMAAENVDDATWRTMDVGFFDASEATVLVIERMLDGLNLTPRRLIDRGRRMLAKFG